MAQRRASYELQDLLASGRGEFLGPGNPQLPLPPMLMFDRIYSISELGGTFDKGQVVASLKIEGNSALDWIFACHLRGDPAIPGSFGLEALWQLTGFYLGWLGAAGKGRALGVGDVKLTGMVAPTVDALEYVVDLKRVIQRRIKLAIADGVVRADGRVVYTATDLMVGVLDNPMNPRS